MKRSFVVLALVLCLSMLLTGCLGRMDGGNVANSPAPALESPAIPSPDIDLMPSSTPDAENRQTGPTEKRPREASRLRSRKHPHVRPKKPDKPRTAAPYGAVSLLDGRMEFCT